ncbi:MAG TPA: DUF2961 domain-containing protein [Fimbriimonadaceae bacterium]|nr:DUF2961 domain-containing protein [Fimbriimonadaceae bacterium]
MIGGTSLGSLPYLRDYRSKRASSFDREGNNSDWWYLDPGSRTTLLDVAKSGCVKHIWMTVGNDDAFPRKLVLRAWWDGEEHPSIECPLGDFFGIGHGLFKNFVCAPFQMSPQDGRGMNCWFPMPFDQARIEIANDGDQRVNLYFYIDYEEYDRPTSELARFHAQWRRESVTDGWLTERLNNENLWDIWSQRPNVTGDDNYVILDAVGDGVYVGCHLDVDCFQRQGNDWYGEGDDMIFIDGEPWPPSLHGTGTEDYFNTAFCPREEYHAPYHGVLHYSGNRDWNWKGKNSVYRYHIEDPIRFRESIRVTIEHGHANKLSNDYSSTAYWYQTEPHKAFPALLPVAARMPRPNEPEFPPVV